MVESEPDAHPVREIGAGSSSAIEPISVENAKRKWAYVSLALEEAAIGDGAQEGNPISCETCLFARAIELEPLSDSGPTVQYGSYASLMPFDRMVESPGPASIESTPVRADPHDQRAQS